MTLSPRRCRKLRGKLLVRTLSPLLAVLVVVAVGCGGQTPPERFSGALEPLNDSGVEGRVEVAAAGEHVTMRIRAEGMEPDRIHEQTLFGFAEGDQEARCPTSDADANGNGFIEAKESESAYGPPLLRLEPYPTVKRDGRLYYELIFMANRPDLRPFEGRVVLLQGRTAPLEPTSDGYVRSLPVACGKLGRARG